MGNLFSRNQPIDVIENMRFAELREWNFWHERMADEEAKTVCAKCGKTYDIRKGKCCGGK